MKEEQILILRQDAEQRAKEVDQLHSSELEQERLHIRDLQSQSELFVAKSEAKLTEMKTKIALFEDQVENTEKILKQERETFSKLITGQKNQLTVEREQLEIEITKEKELRKAMQAEMSELKLQLISFQHTNLKLKADISRKDTDTTRKAIELELNDRALQEKDAIISGLKEQLTKTREYLTTKKQVSGCLVYTRL